MEHWTKACPCAVDSHMLQNGLKVMELPAGLMTGVRALKNLGLPVIVLHSLDLLGYLGNQCMQAFSPADRRHMHFGKSRGDILQLEPQNMEIAHLLLSGPSCQPFSTLGVQGYFRACNDFDNDRERCNPTHVHISTFLHFHISTFVYISTFINLYMFECLHLYMSHVICICLSIHIYIYIFPAFPHCIYIYSFPDFHISTVKFTSVHGMIMYVHIKLA
jgi:hypothetical protein